MDQSIGGPYMIIDEKDTLQDLRDLAEALDTKFHLPFGWKVGWDGIIGLIPGVGDFVTSMMSIYIVYKAAILGCPLSVILRMGLNILIDNVLDAVPLFGNIFDFMWKSNSMNVALVEKYVQNPSRTVTTSRLIVLAAVGIMVLMVVGIAVLTFYLARWFWGIFQNAW